jgi:hypothetical protein
MFCLSKTASHWFKGIDAQHPFKEGAANMNIYYLCALIGLQSNEPPIELEDGLPAFVKTWPQAYSHVIHPIIALFLQAEIKRFSIQIDNKDAVKKHIKNYISPEDSIRLTEMGVKILNNYSYTGFVILKKEFREEPKAATEFFEKYLKILNK